MYMIKIDKDAKKYRNHRPSEKLPDQLRERRSTPGVEVPYTECATDTPDFDVMSEAQQAYYLWFRDRYLQGVTLEHDRGYTWLLLMDLADRDDDPSSVMRDMMRMYEESLDDRGYPAPATISSVMFDYALANGLDLPRVYLSDPASWRMLVSEILSPPPDEVPADIIDKLSGYALGNVWYDCEPDDICSLFNAALPAVDAELRRDGGDGILGRYGDGTVTDTVVLFRDPGRARSRLAGTEVSVTYTASGEKLDTFLGAMLRYCTKVVEREAAGGKGPSVPTVFDKDLRKVVDRVYKGGDIVREPRRPKESRGTERARVDKSDPASLPPFVPQSYEGRKISAHFRSDLKRYEDAEPRGACGYVPSGSRNPEYTSMGEDGLKYYLHWRANARKGVYLPADIGHIWLYQCELINSDLDYDSVMEQLASLAGTYDRYIPEGWNGSIKPGETYLEYSVFHAGPVRMPSVFPCGYSACLMMDEILDGEDVVPDPECMLILGEVKDKSTRAGFDQDCAWIAMNLLRRIDSELSARKRSIRKVHGIKRMGDKMHVFPYLEFYGWESGRRSKCGYRYSGYLWSDSFKADMRELDKAVAKAVKNRGRNKPADLFVFGMDAGGMLTAEVDGWFSGNNATAGADGTSRTPAAGPASSPGNPWDDLVARMNKGQREYFRKAASGSIRSVKAPMEEAINRLAAETVGDRVVENGRILGKHAEDARSAIGRSS